MDETKQQEILTHVELDLPPFIARLLTEINGMDSTLFPPPRDFDPNEESKVIGKVQEWPRKIFALAQMYSRDLDRMKVEAKWTPSDTALAERVECLKEKHHLLMVFFWGCVEDNLQSWKSNLSLGSGWKVTLQKDDDRLKGMPPRLQEILKRLMSNDDLDSLTGE